MKKTIIALLVIMLAITGCGSSVKDGADGQKDQTVVGTEGVNADSGSSDDGQTVQADPVSTCNHEWEEATWYSPKTCSICGATEGEKLALQKGDIITFGSYEQDNDSSNGKEPIEWVVLDVVDGRALLLSRYILNSEKYNTTQKEVTWGDSYLDMWLNVFFKQDAFTDEEARRIEIVTTANPDNPIHGTEGGEDGSDRIFCLSMEEVIKYFDFNEWDEYYQDGFSQALLCEPTAYAASKSLFQKEIDAEYYNEYLKDRGYTEDCIGMTAAWWWLRSPGQAGKYACVVASTGRAGYTVDCLVDGYGLNIGVRPALWVNY